MIFKHITCQKLLHRNHFFKIISVYYLGASYKLLYNSDDVLTRAETKNNDINILIKRSSPPRVIKLKQKPNGQNKCFS